MSAFPILHSALEGFRFTRERPRALLLWGGCVLLMGLVVSAILAATGAQAGVAELQRLAAQTPPDADAAMGLIGRIGPVILLAFVLQCLLFAALACSALRLLLGLDAKPRLSIGRQEGRMVLVGLLLAAASLGASLIVGAPLVGLGRLIGLGAPGPGAFIGFLGQAASVAAQAVVMVRLALAAPSAVAENRVSLARSWARTRGRFWPMLGALMAAAVLYMVVVLLCSFLFMSLSGIVVVATGGELANLPRLLSPGVTLIDVFRPGALAYQLFQAALLAIGVPILAGPLAAAYRILARN